MSATPVIPGYAYLVKGHGINTVILASNAAEAICTATDILILFGGE